MSKLNTLFKPRAFSGTHFSEELLGVSVSNVEGWIPGIGFLEHHLHFDVSSDTVFASTFLGDKYIIGGYKEWGSSSPFWCFGTAHLLSIQIMSWEYRLNYACQGWIYMFIFAVTILCRVCHHILWSTAKFNINIVILFPVFILNSLVHPPTPLASAPNHL